MPSSNKKKIIKLNEIINPQTKESIWLSVSEAAKLCGVQTKTIRRAIQAKEVYPVKSSLPINNIKSSVSIDQHPAESSGIVFNGVKYKVVKNRYLIELASAILYVHKNTKLKNKFYTYGLGQYFSNL